MFYMPVRGFLSHRYVHRYVYEAVRVQHPLQLRLTPPTVHPILYVEEHSQHIFSIHAHHHCDTIAVTLLYQVYKNDFVDWVAFRLDSRC